MLIQEEKQKSIGTSSSNRPFVKSTTLATKVNSGSGSSSGGSYKNHKKGKERPVCNHCGVVGHTMNKCYKIHGYPPRYKSKSKNTLANQVSSIDLGPNSCAQSQVQFGAQPQFPQFHFANQSQAPMQTQFQFPFTPEQCQKLLAMIGGQEAPLTSLGMANNVSLPTQQSTPLVGIFSQPNFGLKHSVFANKIVNRTAFGYKTWVIDTGASDHIVYSMTLLHSITYVTNCIVELPNGESAQVTHIGFVHLSSTLTIHNVLCVPSFSFNLLSVSKLTQKLSYCLVFLAQCCFIQDLTYWRTIGMGEVSNGLYLLQHSPPATARIPPSFHDCLNQSSFPNAFSAKASTLDMSTI